MTDRTTVATIGESIVITGELSADKDLVIEGQVEGTINLNQNVLTVGEHGRVKAKIVAKTVVVVGKVWDSIIAAVPRASTAALLALLLMAVGGATGISRAQSQTEAAPIQKNANDSGHNRLTGAAP